MSKRYLFKLGFLLCLISSPLLAETKVFVQNNTTFTFSVSAKQSGYSLSGSKWGQSTNQVLPGERKEVVWFNRDSGIKWGKYFYFDTDLNANGNQIRLKQKLKGNWVGSSLWQSLSADGISDPWHSDRNTHTAVWYTGGKEIHVKYRAFYTGGYDHVEYILQEEYIVPSSGADTLNVLAYNIYMRPDSLFKNGQFIRAGLIPDEIRGYDVVVFSEAFDDDVRQVLLDHLQSEYPYRTNILGSDRGVEQDGGVIILSKWPLAGEDDLLFGDECSGSDCLSDKGAKYVQVNKQGRIYHLVGTHTQAWTSSDDQETRRMQFLMIKDFLDGKNIPASEALIYAGDMNVDRINYNAEYLQMLEILNAGHPTASGHGYSYDPLTNRLAASGAREYLDYVLYSKAHRQPVNSYNEIRMFRSDEEWKEYFWEYAYWDLSDHYAQFGRLEFASEELQVPANILPLVTQDLP